MKYVLVLIIGVTAFLAVLSIGLRIGNAIDNKGTDKQELIPYPEFETVMTQPYCKGMADITLAEEWDKQCSKLLKERHCALEPDTVDSLIAQAERSIQMCER